MPDANKKPENPEAFAFGFGTDNYSDIQRGMTLRDYFAAKAIQGMLSHSIRYKPRVNSSGNWHEAISEEAYQIAEAMLKQREL